MIGKIGFLFGAVFICSCSSLPFSEKPVFCPNIRLSQLSETTLEFDSSRYAGINLKIINDLESDVFFKHGSCFVKNSINQETTHRIPDTNERYKKYEGTGVCPMQYAETFTFIWSGNAGFCSICDSATVNKCYFPITYFHCKDKTFYTTTIKITEANQSVGAK